jgi:hypothetical protein
MQASRPFTKKKNSMQASVVANWAPRRAIGYSFDQGGRLAVRLAESGRNCDPKLHNADVFKV